jgi:hypothetical protein
MSQPQHRQSSSRDPVSLANSIERLAQADRIIGRELRLRAMPVERRFGAWPVRQHRRKGDS